VERHIVAEHAAVSQITPTFPIITKHLLSVLLPSVSPGVRMATGRAGGERSQTI